MEEEFLILYLDCVPRLQQEKRDMTQKGDQRVGLRHRRGIRGTCSEVAIVEEPD
jgi:hypothetical protein